MRQKQHLTGLKDLPHELIARIALEVQQAGVAASDDESFEATRSLARLASTCSSLPAIVYPLLYESCTLELIIEIGAGPSKPSSSDPLLVTKRTALWLQALQTPHLKLHLKGIRLSFAYDSSEDLSTFTCSIAAVVFAFAGCEPTSFEVIGFFEATGGPNNYVRNVCRLVLPQVLQALSPHKIRRIVLPLVNNAMLVHLQKMTQLSTMTIENSDAAPMKLFDGRKVWPQLRNVAIDASQLRLGAAATIGLSFCCQSLSTLQAPVNSAMLKTMAALPQLESLQLILMPYLTRHFDFDLDEDFDDNDAVDLLERVASCVLCKTPTLRRLALFSGLHNFYYRPSVGFDDLRPQLLSSFLAQLSASLHLTLVELCHRLWPVTQLKEIDEQIQETGRAHRLRFKIELVPAPFELESDGQEWWRR